MYCPSCGKEVLSGFKFCAHCGEEVPEEMYGQAENNTINQIPLYQNPVGQVVVAQQKTNPYAIASLVLGIVGFPMIAAASSSALFGMIAMSIMFLIPNMLSIVFGIMAIRKCKSDPFRKGTGLAIAGMICGGISLLIGLMVSINTYNTMHRFPQGIQSLFGLLTN